MTGMKQINAIAALTAIVVGVSSAPAWSDTHGVKNDPNSGITDTTIKIGWMGDETGGGASVEVPDLHGLQAYIDYVNAKGGILGHKIEMIDVDDKFRTDNGTVNFRRLMNDEHVLTITNMGGSQISTPLAPAVAAAKIPVILPSQTVDAQLNVPYFFNLIPHYSDQADVIVGDAVKTAGGAAKVKMFVVRLAVPSGEEFDQYVQRALKAAGGEYVGTATVGLTQNDYTPTVVAIKEAMAKGANFVALHGSGPGGLGIMTALSKAEVKIPVTGINSMAAPDVFTNGPKDAMAHFGAVQAVLPISSGVPGGQAARDYVASHPQYAKDALEPYFTMGWLTGVLLQNGIEQAVKQNAGTLNKDTLFAALSSMKLDTGGLTCPLDFSGPLHYTPCAALMVWDGKSLQLKDSYASYSPMLERKYGLK